ncbi:MAG: polysaccharide deacetylase family protein [Bacteroidetes bacterium]|nr:polysaccharide deacetylase family protein [Bacteroidota bacterium]
MSPRLQYVLEEIFKHRLGMQYRVTQNISEYEGINDGIKINYSVIPRSGFHIIPVTLLKEEAVNESLPEFDMGGSFPVLFPTNSAFGFDIFSMVFWFLCRYEEYQTHDTDKHGRFLPGKFIPEPFRSLPIIDIALNAFYQEIGVQLVNKYGVYPTLDIDIAFAHKGRTPLVWLGGLLRYFLIGDWTKAKERIQVLFGKSDPYDSFDYMIDTLKGNPHNCRFFIQVSDRGLYDKSIAISNPSFSKIVTRIASQFETGIHPGYEAGQTADGIQKEKIRLEKHIGKTITRSRHHFLKVKLPETYRNLLQAGITHDYSMGYADRLGFRAGTGQSFRFFDLLKNESTELVVHPFCAMDVSLKNYLELHLNDAGKAMQELNETCRKHHTPFCFIFHNESLSNSGDWDGYRSIFEKCLN